MSDLVNNCKNDQNQVLERPRSNLLKTFLMACLFIVLSLIVLVTAWIVENPSICALIVCAYSALVYVIIKNNKYARKTNDTIMISCLLFIFITLISVAEEVNLLLQISWLISFVFLNYHSIKTFNLHKPIISIVGGLSSLIIMLFSVRELTPLSGLDFVMFLICMAAIHQKFKFNSKSIFIYNTINSFTYFVFCILCISLSQIVPFIIGFLTLIAAAIIFKRKDMFEYPIITAVIFIYSLLIEEIIVFIALIGFFIHGVAMFISKCAREKSETSNKNVHSAIKTFFKAFGQMVLLAAIMMFLLYLSEQFYIIEIEILAPIFAILYSTLIFVMGYKRRNKVICWIGSLLIAVLITLNEINGFEANQMLYPYILVSSFIFISLMFVAVITFYATKNINLRNQKIKENKTEIIEEIYGCVETLTNTEEKQDVISNDENDQGQQKEES